jgi:tetratricopeptide (TPR) repeat protein
MHNLAIILSELGPCDEAIELRRQLLEFWERRVRETPEERRARESLAAAHDAIAWVFLQLKQWAEMQWHWESAMEIREALTRDFPEELAYKSSLARNCRGLGIWHGFRQQYDLARKYYERALQLSRELVAAAPSVKKYQDDLDKDIVNLSSLLADRVLKLATATDPAQRDPQQVVALANEAIEMNPKNAHLHSVRAEACLALGRYDEALADLNRWAELTPDDAVAALVRAQVLVLADRIEAYRQVCGEILERFGPSQDPVVACHAVRACALAPQAVPDPLVPVELAARAVSSNPSEWTLYSLGMAHLRAGEFDEAERRFQESLEKAPAWTARFLNQFGLALVHHERGEVKEEAVALMEEDPGPTTQDRLEAQLLRREVERLLANPDKNQQDGSPQNTRDQPPPVTPTTPTH